jgi:hypothetical protein
MHLQADGLCVFDAPDAKAPRFLNFVNAARVYEAEPR